MLDLTKKTKERVILVGAGEKFGKTDCSPCSDPIEELRLLADTAGAEVVGTVFQARSLVDVTYYIGKGKVQELKEEVERLGASTVIFDNDLAPAQVSNLEEFLDVKVIDRTGLILDIFALRAKTREAKTQVELAQLKYLLPRLTRRWTHLSRQVGGIGVRGPGETQLEVDRRRVRSRIAHLSGVLEKIDRQRSISRQKRSERFKAALVGYTNAGKSTLLNSLSGADVPVEDKLFKTLDSVTRLIRFKDAPDILLSDTVGFIRDLPHDLVASFKSTLDEVRDADVLLHVIDSTNPDWEEQSNVVNQVLGELGVTTVPIITIFNKIDLVDNLQFLLSLRSRYPDSIAVSSAQGTGLDILCEALKKAAMAGQITLTMDFGSDENALLREIYRHAVIRKTEGHGEIIRLTFTLPVSLARKLHLYDILSAKLEKS
ncbi:MAG: GTPase HflX [Candidatus Latescibacter sp.]|nr:GTPase HflX [Candidatus Latescibacter sp.]